MKNLLVEVPSIRTPIMPAPGFAKKGLATYKLDLMALCGFGCSYCSSNWGNYLRTHREDFAALTEEQLGQRLYPDTSPDLAMLWPDVLTKLEAQVTQRRAKKGAPWGTGETLVFSMLTDGFSPVLVGNGTTEAALRLVLERTGFRIRVLTKNAVVGSDRWIRFFLDHPGRFVVGLSCGTMDDEWAAVVERGTSSPRARLAALRALQDAGVPTFGMLCPIFPDVAATGDDLRRLVDAIRPDRCETVWAEPFNDRANWENVRAGYSPESLGYRRLTAMYGSDDRVEGRRQWSIYATWLYSLLRAKAEVDGWLPKLSYLLYEDGIIEADAKAFSGLVGVLLQSKPHDGEEGDPRNGYSPNPHMAALQATPQSGRVA